MTHKDNQYVHPRVLKINVGYLIAEGNGANRTISLDFPERLKISDDLVAESLHGDLKFTTTSEGILVQGSVECGRWAECSRCLDETLITYDIVVEELFVSDHNYESEFYIGEDAILDLAPLLREEAYTHTPYQILCRNDCKGLCKTCGHNLNEGACECDLENVDPRWAALADLQKRLEK